MFSDNVIEYFRLHAKDPKFQEYCANISDEERELIKVALAFSVAGRESEASWSGSNEKYNQYRQASADAFEKFCLELMARYPDKQTQIRLGLTDKMIARYKELVLHLNVPEKFIYDKSDPTRHFIEIIMSFSHTLDLPRCYGIDAYKTSMGQYDKVVDTSGSQPDDLSELERFAAQAIKDMGDKLLFVKEGNDKYVETKSASYEKPFDLYSTSVKACETYTCGYQIQWNKPESDISFTPFSL